jgi:flagellar M-ring protein FliF
MANAVPQFSQLIVQRFALLGLNQKLMIGTLVLSMMGAGFFLFQKTTDDYDVLYSNMSLPDASATVAKLKEMNEPFKLADNGTTVLVHRSKKSELMLETAGDLSSNQPVSLTKIPPVLQGDVQKEWLKKFNADSIGESLTAIEGIHQAKVMIAQADKTVFTTGKDPTRASVMLVVEPGFKLKESQVKTIKNLVSHAVPGLKNDDVAISDNFGNSLEDPTTANGGMMSDAESKRRQIEEETKQKILGLIEPLAGKDNAVVSVTAELNFNQARSKIHSVTPLIKDDKKATGLVVSEQLQAEEYSGAPKAEGGAPGTAPNSGSSSGTGAPSYQANSAEGDKGKNYKNTRTTTNYAHSEEDREVIYATGQVERMTVAVILNKVLTTTETQELKEAISTAAGIKPERGDSVDVKGFEFSVSPGEKSEELSKAFQQAQFQEFALQIGYLASMILLGMAALFVFYNLMKRPPVQGEMLADDDEYEDDEADALTGGGQDDLAGMLSGVVVGGKEPAKMITINTTNGPKVIPALPKLDSKIRPEIEEMRQAMYTTIQGDPQEAAKILSNFMHE